jgi:redox-sensitive bicupin YhaK (pirin superfamily)
MTMLRHVPFASLGRFETDWLDSRFHFYFAGVPAPMGTEFGPLRVWNDDLIQPHTGFDTHGHRDMEIITYVRRGAISHRDSLGHEGRIGAGEVQVMSAGRGIRHAEWNHEDGETLLYQIWVEPERRDLEPRWAQAPFPKDDRQGRLVALASGQEGIAGALRIHQDATLYGALLAPGDGFRHRLGPGRRAYLVLADGELEVGQQRLSSRDGCAIQDVDAIDARAVKASEVLLFDLPGPRPQGR